MKKTRIAINGFGRIGRNAFKIALTKKDVDIVAINDLTDTETLAHLLKYDTVYGKYGKPVIATKEGIKVGRKVYPVTANPDPAKLPWKKYKVDVVLECTGFFVKDHDAEKHLTAGAKQVIISAPAKGDSPAPTHVIGVNHTEKAASTRVINNASCTTNCIAPPVAVMNNALGVLKSTMTTIHGYTSTQNLVDGPHKDLRRTRAAAENIIPTTTGAAIATTQVIPELRGLFDGVSLRVPVPVGSISDIVMLVKKKTTVEEVNRILQRAEKHPLYKGVIKTTEEPIVSSDIIGESASSVVDLSLTQVIDGDLVKIMAWYDNEWGYSNRLVEQAQYVGKQLA